MPGKTINDVMTRNPETVTPKASIADAARLMRDEDVGSLPVVDADRLVGTITDRDIAVRVVAEGRDTNTAVGDIASRELVTVDVLQDVDEAARLMAKHQVRRLPVCEEDGRLVGIVAQADLAIHANEKRTAETVEQISR